MTGYMSRKRGERGLSALGIVVAIGAVVLMIGLAIMVSTDSQIRTSFLGQKERDSDWTVRSTVKLVEDAWRRFAGVTPVAGNPNQFTGTLLDAITVLSREADLQYAINQATAENTDKYALWLFSYDWMVRNDKTSWNAQTQVPHPDTYSFQVDLRQAGVTTDKDGDGIVAYDPATGTQIWNNLDNSGTRQYNAIITITPNGFPHTVNNAMFVFPVKFNIAVTTRNAGLQEGKRINRTVTGSGSCAFYLFRRSFSEYVMFANIFKTESNGDIQLPADFTYGGPVHTNTHFYFTGNPSTKFLDMVTQHEQKAAFGSASSLLDQDETSTVKPQFKLDASGKKMFYRGVPEIAPPTDYGDYKQCVLNGRSVPASTGVYMPKSGGGYLSGSELSGTAGLDQGGIYIKGNVKSFNLQQGNRSQTYTITQQQSVVSGPTTVNTYPDTGSSSTALVWNETITTVTRDTVYTITCDYDANQTTWVKKTVQTTTVLKNVYRRGNKSTQWTKSNFMPLESTTTITQTVLSTDQSTTYTGVPNAVAQDPSNPHIQPAIYIEGDLGVTGTHKSTTDFSGNNKGVPQTTAPTGLSGTLDKDTELSICASGQIVLVGDTTYETQPNLPNKDNLISDRNVLGLLTETDKVYIDYDQPYGRDVNIDASIMAVHDGTSAAQRGVFTALDYQITLGAVGNKPTINLFGGVVQAYYGAVGQSTGGGYLRNFLYDKRLKTAPPPLYPRQAACTMQTTNESNKNSLQLIWQY